MLGYKALNKFAGINKKILVIKAGSLKEGQSYIMQLTQGEAYSELSLQTNQPPSGGSCTVNPSEGMSLSVQIQNGVSLLLGQHLVIFLDCKDVLGNIGIGGQKNPKN